MSQAIAERRAEAGRPTVSLVFPDTGHDLGPSLLHPIEAMPGATPESIGQAKLAIWEATVDLFDRAMMQGDGSRRPTPRRTP